MFRLFPDAFLQIGQRQCIGEFTHPFYGEIKVIHTAGQCPFQGTGEYIAMRFQFSAVEFGEVAFEIVGDLEEFCLPGIVFQRQNREVRMTADTIKRKTKGAWIQIRFSGVFFLLLLQF